MIFVATNLYYFSEARCVLQLSWSPQLPWTSIWNRQDLWCCLPEVEHERVLSSYWFEKVSGSTVRLYCTLTFQVHLKIFAVFRFHGFGMVKVRKLQISGGTYVPGSTEILNSKSLKALKYQPYKHEDLVKTLDLDVRIKFLLTPLAWTDFITSYSFVNLITLGPNLHWHPPHWQGCLPREVRNHRPPPGVVLWIQNQILFISNSNIFCNRTF